MRRFSGIQSVAFGFVVLLLEIVADGCVGRVLHLDDEAGRPGFFAGGETLVCPVHECLGNKNCIQAVGEPYNLTFELLCTSVAP